MKKIVLNIGDFRVHRHYGPVKIVKVLVWCDLVAYHVMTERGTVMPNVYPSELV